MLYALICTDRPGQLELRMKVRPDHLAFLDGLGAAMKGAGPFFGDDAKANGSLIIIEAESKAAAEAIAARDPYALAGLFQSVDVRPWKWLLQNPWSA